MRRQGEPSKSSSLLITQLINRLCQMFWGEVQIPHRCLNVPMSHKFFDCSYMYAFFCKGRSESMSEVVNLPTVMNLMGHSDIQTDMIYAHLAPDHLADAVNKLSF